MPDRATITFLQEQADEADDKRAEALAALMALLEASRVDAIGRLTDQLVDLGEPMTRQDVVSARGTLEAWVAQVIQQTSGELTDAAREARRLAVADTLALYRRFERDRDALERLAYELSLYVDNEDPEERSAFVAPLGLYLAAVAFDVARSLETSRRQGVPAGQAIRDALGAERSAWARRRGDLQQDLDRALVDAAQEAVDRAAAEGNRQLPDAQRPRLPGDAGDIAPPADDPPAADPVVRMIVELRDNRNHPISRVIDGQTRPVGELFRAPVAEVAAMAAAMGRNRIGPVYWRVEGGDFVGTRLPAHPYERGRIIPWRASWDAGRR